MSNFLAANNNEAFASLGQGEDDWYNQYGINPQDMGINPGLDTGSNFLGAAGNFFGGKDGMSNAGSLLGGIAGMYGMYQSHQAGKDNAKNNSLYRELMRDEANYKNKFRSGWGNTSWGGK